MAKIIVVGLGYGDPGALTRRGWEVLTSGQLVFVRTRQHPVVTYLERQGIKTKDFDYIYQQQDTFAEVYLQICKQLLAFVRTTDCLVYAVPGDPSVGEKSVALLRQQGEQEGVGIEVVPGTSFIEPVLKAVGEGLDSQLTVADALDFDRPLSSQHPLLLFQVYSRLVASDLKIKLLQYYAAEHRVAIVIKAGLPEQQVLWIELSEVDHGNWYEHLTSLYVPSSQQPNPCGDINSLLSLLSILRSPRGCPWDKEQTHTSLIPYLLEECYELADALQGKDGNKICEELGDLLLQVALHAQIAKETGTFGFSDVVRGIAQKIYRRHPHVFGAAKAANTQQVNLLWQSIKDSETGSKAGKQSPLPALLLLQKLVQGGQIRPEHVSDPLHREMLSVVQRACRENRCLEAEIAGLCAKICRD